MIPTIPQPRSFSLIYGAYVALFFVFLALPLTVVAVFAFNDSQFPSLPWQGFTGNWFFGDERPQIGVFHERGILRAVGTSALVASCVSVLSVAVGTTNAFLFNRYEFRGKGLLYVLMLLPLVIPGIVLGISILVFSSTVANGLWDLAAIDVQALRPGLLRTVTLPFLAPALIGALVVAFLMSFENFNTTLMLVGSDAPLTIAMFDRLKEGSTPLLNAVSLLLMLGSSLLALIVILFQRRD